MEHPDEKEVPCGTGSRDSCPCCAERMIASTLLDKAVEENEKLREEVNRLAIQLMAKEHEAVRLYDAYIELRDA